MKESNYHKFLNPILRFAFYLLYHQFAWSYDRVAKMVSSGKWFTWVQAVLPYISNSPVLELGFGTGHLQVALADDGHLSFGIDASPNMSRIVQKRLRQSGKADRLLIGKSQALPFAALTFPTVVATFPSEYIVETQTLKEIWRILIPGGQLLIIPMAWITGKSLPERLTACIFNVTGLSNTNKDKYLAEYNYTHATIIQDLGYTYAQELIDLASSTVLLVILTKPPQF